MKLSLAQSTLLRLIAQADWKYALAPARQGGIWLPRVDAEYLQILDYSVRIIVHGSGVAQAWKALVSRQLIEPITLAAYAARITPLGREVVRSEWNRSVLWVSVL